jgi:hypothetical protein
MAEKSFPARMMVRVDSFLVLALFSTKVRASAHNEQFHPATTEDVQYNVTVLLEAERLHKRLFASSEIEVEYVWTAAQEFALKVLDQRWLLKDREWSRAMFLECIQQCVVLHSFLIFPLINIKLRHTIPPYARTRI